MRTAYVKNYRDKGDEPTYYLAENLKFLNSSIPSDENISRALRNLTHKVNAIKHSILDVQCDILQNFYQGAACLSAFKECE